jgi:hypothetical protein
VHRVHIFVTELAQAEARGCEGRVRRGPLHELQVAGLAQKLGPDVVAEVVEAEAGYAGLGA